MNKLEQLEKRRLELLSRPRSKEEIEESLELDKEIELERAIEYEEMKPELEKIGININSIWDLVNTKKLYPAAIDTLIKYLLKVKHDRNLEGFARALTVKEAKGKASIALISIYESIPKEKEDLRWAIGNAIATTMTNTDIPWLFVAVQDSSSGRSRGQLIRAVATVKTEEAENILIKLLDDNKAILPAIQSLGKIKSKKAKDKLLSLTGSTNRDVNQEALKAIKKIEN
ncbi:hypothetical protein FA048_02930 [Pedobacter polaris]|uniref:HEAT repeat domain-containing protein n=1 Tax=Pedobacter polaris TaxID=2571273 RepID=A0A4U1CTQ6_9SPHI|nr:hypothetical protein [Pedobacter polaris]TKC12587.1 hypothetical protein FA048_02930 [Pedobacter polaris]